MSSAAWASREGGRPLVSVIVPTYNRAELLRLTIESVLAQRWQPLELIVVDDGSRDGTPALLRSYGDRLRVIRQDNAGGTAARNAGTRAARGAYLNWLDHDDLMHPDKIARQLAVFRAHPALGLVHCGYERIDREGRVLERITGLPEGDVRARLVCGCFVWSGAPLVRREVIEQVGLFDETVWSSDADLWLRIALAGWRWGCVQEPLGQYRILPDSTMADVARTERLDMAILDRVFADPRLPAAARANRHEAYFNQRFWLATRYYTIGDWEAAGRNLREAFRWKPELLDEADELVAYFGGAAMDPRVDDPLRFVDGVLAHLPPEAAVVVALSERLRSHVALRLALRAYAHGAVAEGRVAFDAAVRIDPGLLDRPSELAAALAESARRLPVVLEPYVATVFAHLPDSAAVLRPHRRAFLGHILLAAAARAWGQGQRSTALRDLVRALRCHPRLGAELLRRLRRRGRRVARRSAVALLGEPQIDRLVAMLRGREALPLVRP